MKQIALADDHTLLRKGLASLVQNLGFTVVLEADNGQELIEKLPAGSLPDLVLMDINMPEKDGYETTFWLKENYPDIKVLGPSKRILLLGNGDRKADAQYNRYGF
jgi:two-component system, NarL family, invasion response regulator UvrY